MGVASVESREEGYTNESPRSAYPSPQNPSALVLLSRTTSNTQVAHPDLHLLHSNTTPAGGTSPNPNPAAGATASASASPDPGI